MTSTISSEEMKASASSKLIFTRGLRRVAMSLAFIRPVHRIDNALAKIAVGDSSRRVYVPNRNEFGTLGINLNSTTERLGHLYEEMQSLNRNLQVGVDVQVQELERATRMKRYLSLQLAESIL